MMFYDAMAYAGLHCGCPVEDDEWCITWRHVRLTVSRVKNPLCSFRLLRLGERIPDPCVSGSLAVLLLTVPSQTVTAVSFPTPSSSSAPAESSPGQS